MRQWPCLAAGPGGAGQNRLRPCRPARGCSPGALGFQGASGPARLDRQALRRAARSAEGGVALAKPRVRRRVIDPPWPRPRNRRPICTGTDQGEHRR